MILLRHRGFNELLAAFPVGQEADPERLEFERRRAQTTRQARAVADAIDESIEPRQACRVREAPEVQSFSSASSRATSRP